MRGEVYWGCIRAPIKVYIKVYTKAGQKKYYSIAE
jgi:hypothetical protein